MVLYAIYDPPYETSRADPRPAMEDAAMIPQTLANLARYDIIIFLFSIAILACAAILVMIGIGSLVGTVIYKINHRGPYSKGYTYRRRGVN